MPAASRGPAYSAGLSRLPLNTLRVGKPRMPNLAFMSPFFLSSMSTCDDDARQCGQGAAVCRGVGGICQIL